MYYEPTEKEAPSENLWSSESCFDFIPALFERLTSAGIANSDPTAESAGNDSQLPVSRITGCAVKRRWSTAGVNPPGNWFAPPGSNQSSSGGNETAEASGAESRKATWRACRP